MANFIHLAKDLIERIPEEFQNLITTATARQNPEKTIQTRSIPAVRPSQVWRGKTVNTRSPELMRTLKQLANQGSGHTTVYNGVTSKFLLSRYTTTLSPVLVGNLALDDVNNSGTTTPVSSL